MADDGGLARFQRRMAAIPRAVKDSVRAALEKSAGDVVEMAKALCPVDDGDLRDSIGWTWGMAPSGSVTLAQSIAGEMVITVYAGNEKAFYARWVEFGTQSGVFGQRAVDKGAGKKQAKAGRKSYRTHGGTEAQPFLYPAFRLTKKRNNSRIRRAVRKACKDNWGKS